MNNKNMDDTHPTSPEAWRLQILKLLQANPSLSQRQLAERLGVSLGKANYCLRALVEKGLVKLGKNHNNCYPPLISCQRLEKSGACKT